MNLKYLYRSTLSHRLSAASSELATVMSNLKEKQDKLASVEQKIAELQKAYDDSVSEKQHLEHTMGLTTARLNRAGKLTTALADEKIRWSLSVEVSIRIQNSESESEFRIKI